MDNTKRKKGIYNMGALGLFAAVAVITVIIAIAINLKKNKNGQRKKTQKEAILEDAFGSNMYIDTVKVEQVTGWVKERNQLLKNGAKALVMKATPKSLNKLGVNVKLDGVNENFLVIALVKGADMKDSLLIKYDQLDDQLEKLLAKGDGMLVIND